METTSTNQFVARWISIGAILSLIYVDNSLAVISGVIILVSAYYLGWSEKRDENEY